YVNTLVALSHGARKWLMVSRSVWQGVFFSILSIPVLLACIPLGTLVLDLTGHEPTILELEKDYFFILMLGGLTLPLGASFSSFFSGRGQTSIVLLGNLCGNIFNIVMDYILIFGKFGFPELGIQGAAIATSLSNLIPLAIWFFLFLSKRYQIPYKTRKHIVWDKKLFLTLMKFGIPSGAQFILDIGSFTAFVLIVGKLGVTDLAITNIALSIESLSFLPMVGISIATATLVGEYIGQRRLDIAQKSVNSALILSITYSGILSVLFLVIPEQLLRLFINESTAGLACEEFFTRGCFVVRLIGLYTVFDTIFIVYTGALKGAGDTKFAMWAQIVLAWIFFVPPVYFMIIYYGLGLYAAWIWLLIYIVILAVIFHFRFRSGHWKSIKIIG
ncbi:MAG: MATE family efflux transporter, partial [Desulfomonilaceae bacterium]